MPILGWRSNLLSWWFLLEPPLGVSLRHTRAVNGYLQEYFAIFNISHRDIFNDSWEGSENIIEKNIN